VTRNGMTGVVTTLTGKAPIIFEPWNTGDTGGWDTGTVGFDLAGAWGDPALIAQSFITVTRPGVEGIPNVSGWDNGAGGWDVGSIEWTDQSMIVGNVTDSDIYDAVNVTRATGTIAWVAIEQDFVRLSDNVSFAYVIHKLAEFDGARWWVDANGN
jgi:hypothetical protein